MCKCSFISFNQFSKNTGSNFGLEIQSIHIVNLSFLCLYPTIALVVFIRILNVLHQVI